MENDATRAAALVKYRLFLFVLVNASIPLWTLFLATQFPLHLKIIIGLVSAVFMNLALILGFRMKDRATRKDT